jgi:hypothetical protein
LAAAAVTNDLLFSPCLDLIGAHGKLFFDVYNTNTAKKVITLTAKFGRRVLPEGAFEGTTWITDQYFIVPLDAKRERCLVCDFGRAR